MTADASWPVPPWPNNAAYYTGVVEHTFRNKKGQWGNSYIEEGCWLGGTQQWKKLSDEFYARDNLTRCKICHPSPVPPFPDCPHGHYLTPSRLQAQMDWSLIRDVGFYTVVWFFTALVGVVVPIVSVVITGLWLINMLGFYVERRDRKKKRDILIERAGPFAENPNIYWEKRTRINEPWIQRVF